MRHPLHDQPARTRKLVEQPAGAIEIGRLKPSEDGVNRESFAGFPFGRPDVQLLACIAQPAGKLSCVRGDTPQFRRVFGREQVNHAHWRASRDESAYSRRMMNTSASGARGTSVRDSDVPTCVLTSGHALKT